MVQANPISQIVNLRRDQWAIGLVNSAQIASQDAARKVVQASQCERDSCQFCDIGQIPPPSQSSGPAVATTLWGANEGGAPFFTTMTPEKL